MISARIIAASLLLVSGVAKSLPQLDFKACNTQKCTEYFQEYKKYARSHASAAGILGTMYLVGYGTEANEEEALRYFKFGATFDDPESALKAGLLLQRSDPERALKYLKQAAYLDSANAAYFLVRHFGDKDSSSESLEETDKWLAKAVELEHPHVDSLIEKITADTPVTPESFPHTWQAMEDSKAMVLADAGDDKTNTLVKERGPKEVERITVTGMSLDEAMDAGIYSMYSRNGDTFSNRLGGKCRRDDPGCQSVLIETSTRVITYN